MYFKYGTKEIEHLKKQDIKLAKAIEKIGLINREVIDDIYLALVNSIVSQQISKKAFITVWNRFLEKFSPITPININKQSIEDLQSIGISFRKANYIKELTSKVVSGELDLDNLSKLSDEEVIKELIKLNGIGRWTAEMILLFTLKREDILSYGDYAIRKGMRIIFELEELNKATFEDYRKRLSPYNSVASLYFWEASTWE